METPQQSALLKDYVDFAELHRQLEHTYETPDSLQWFIRNHGGELAAAGAMILAGRGRRFNPPLVEKVAVEVGRAAIAARHPVR